MNKVIPGYTFTCCLTKPVDVEVKRSLLRRLQAKILPDAISQTDNIHPSSKMASTFESVVPFLFLLIFRIS